MKKVIISVSNDLTTDQRVQKISDTLLKNGFAVLLIGRKLPHSLKIDVPYKTHRFNLIFTKGFFFYAEFNIRLFFKLMFEKTNLLYSNDLDTLLPNYLIHKIFKTKLIYDSHELFTEVPELIDKSIVRNFWLKLELLILPKINNCITVSYSIANYYKLKYNTNFKVIRNVPKTTLINQLEVSNYNPTKKIILYQGALNKGRGLELLIDAMIYLNNYTLIIVGNGDIENELKKRVTFLNIDNRVEFIAKKIPNELKKITALAQLGISLEEDLGLNYQFALPNKLFDYIHAKIPVLTSDLVEMKQIINKYKIGFILEKRNPIYLAEKIKSILETNMPIPESNFNKAIEELNWEKESQILINLVNKVS